MILHIMYLSTYSFFIHLVIHYSHYLFMSLLTQANRLVHEEIDR